MNIRDQIGAVCVEHFDVQLDYFVKRQTVCGWEIPPRYIANFELVLVIKGQGIVTVDDASYRAAAGDLFFFRPGVRHSLKAEQEPCMEFYGVHFFPLPGQESIPIPDHAHLQSYNRLHIFFKMLMDAYRQRDFYAKWRQNLLLEQILCEILTLLRLQDEPIEAERIREVLRYIHENPYEKMTLDQLIEMAHMKKTSFMRLFRRITGTTPNQYMIRLHMDEARDLLLETNLSVAQIAEQCGFTDPFYFSRCFKNHFLISPQKYRRNCTGEARVKY